MTIQKIPYGLSDFKSIREENYLYIDKTKYIETLEDLSTKYPVFLRPRRFGKSLLVSSLFYYYDRNSKESFDDLFGDLYIGSHKTMRANQYYVLRFEFSGLETENEDQLREAFYRRVIVCLKDFIRRYSLKITIRENEYRNAATLLDEFLGAVIEYTGKMVYIMIDEYDQFANNIVGNQDFFTSITSKDGFIRRFYEVFKAHAGGGCIDRIFITGVTSMTLDSLTSGFNIAKNISMREELNEMVGFTENETRNALQQVKVAESEEVISLLTEHYNGYIFCTDFSSAERVLNSNLVLYFMDEYKMRNRIPEKMTDVNIRSDYQKLTQIFQLFKDSDSRDDILQDILEGKSVDANIITDFTFTSSFNRHEFLSMLYYLGLLTIKSAGGIFDVRLEPPNAVIRDVYYKYYMEYLNIDEVKKLDAVGAIAFQHDFKKFNELITHILRNHSNEDYKRFDESRLKSIFLLCLSDQKVYLIKSEYESGGKRPDIALLDIRGGKTSVKYNYLIELKYLKKSDAAAEKIEEKIHEARDQMNNYLHLSEFADDDRIKGIIYVIVKDEIVCFEEMMK